MNQDMIQFYNDKNILISEVMRRGGKQMLTEPQIIEGLQAVYDRVQGGEKIKDISLIWQAWEEARRSQGKEYLEWCLSRDEYMIKIDLLERSIVNRDSVIWSLITIFVSTAIFWYWSTYV